MTTRRKKKMLDLGDDGSEREHQQSGPQKSAVPLEQPAQHQMSGQPQSAAASDNRTPPETTGLQQSAAVAREQDQSQCGQQRSAVPISQPVQHQMSGSQKSVGPARRQAPKTIGHQQSVAPARRQAQHGGLSQYALPQEQQAQHQHGGLSQYALPQEQQAQHQHGGLSQYALPLQQSSQHKRTGFQKSATTTNSQSVAWANPQQSFQMIGPPQSAMQVPVDGSGQQQSALSLQQQLPQQHNGQFAAWTNPQQSFPMTGSPQSAMQVPVDGSGQQQSATSLHQYCAGSQPIWQNQQRQIPFATTDTFHSSAATQSAHSDHSKASSTDSLNLRWKPKRIIDPQLSGRKKVGFYNGKSYGDGLGAKNKYSDRRIGHYYARQDLMPGMSVNRVTQIVDAQVSSRGISFVAWLGDFYGVPSNKVKIEHYDLHEFEDGPSAFMDYVQQLPFKLKLSWQTNDRRISFYKAMKRQARMAGWKKPSSSESGDGFDPPRNFQ